MKTRDRILAKSLEMFNEQGERLVSTNHIAAALGMSPGNLYYHFANKEAIIFELFQRYSTQMHQTMLKIMPTDRPFAQSDKIELFEKALESIWQYRFMHRDLTHLVEDSEKLCQAYREFAHAMIGSIRLIYKLQIDSGLIEATDDEVDSLLVNLWIITVSWVNFLCTTGLFGYSDPLTEAMLRQGIYQIVCLEAPYLRGEARATLVELKARYGKPLLTGQ